MGLNSYLRSFSWALLFFIISAASAWEITTESSDGFTVMLPDLTVEMKTVGDKVYFEKTDFAGLPGQPGVPAKAISILLPPNVDPNNVTVSLVDVKYETITGAWDVAPAPPYMINENQAIWPQNLTIVDGRDMFTYGNNAFSLRLPWARCPLGGCGNGRSPASNSFLISTILFRKSCAA